MNNNHTVTLFQANRTLLHTQDIAVLFNISNKNTLYTTIKRYVQRGILHPVYKGLYSTTNLSQINPWLLGLSALHTFGYVSCESILAPAGFMNHVPHAITLMSSSSKQFSVGSHVYRARQLQDRFLFHPFGVTMQNGIRQANVERAIADVLYVHPTVHFDAPIDWSIVRKTQKEIGYPITDRTL